MREIPKVRLFDDESGNGQEAVCLLRNAGCEVITIPVNGMGGPDIRVKMGGCFFNYYGMIQIRMFIESLK